jgi:hypothetical protein
MNSNIKNPPPLLQDQHSKDLSFDSTSSAQQKDKKKKSKESRGKNIDKKVFQYQMQNDTMPGGIQSAMTDHVNSTFEKNNRTHSD